MYISAATINHMLLLFLCVLVSYITMCSKDYDAYLGDNLRSEAKEDTLNYSLILDYPFFSIIKQHWTEHLH